MMGIIDLCQRVMRKVKDYITPILRIIIHTLQMKSLEYNTSKYLLIVHLSLSLYLPCYSDVSEYLHIVAFMEMMQYK